MDPRYYVRQWFDKKGYKMKPSGTYEGESAIDFNQLWLDYESFYIGAIIAYRNGQIPKPRKIAETNMKKAWEIFMYEERANVLNKFKENLKFIKEDDTELKKWMSGVLESYGDFETAVIKHVLWQVKRRLFGGKIVFHLCPAFWGAQDGGKSTAIKALIEPLKDVTLEWDPGDSVDSRNLKALSENFIVLHDEMAGLARIEIGKIKKLLTADTLDFRPLYTNRNIKVSQNCAFIGISNSSLIENVYDSTGLRRFVELKCFAKLKWDLINSVDALKIWQSIDETLKRGYIESFKAQLTAHQKDLEVMDEITHFMREMEVVPETEGETVEIPAFELWTHYRDWRMTSGYSPRATLVLTSFCIRLRTHNLHKKEKKIDGKNKIVYTVNAASHIFETKKVSEPKTSLQWNQ